MVKPAAGFELATCCKEEAAALPRSYSGNKKAAHWRLSLNVLRQIPRKQPELQNIYAMLTRGLFDKKKAPMSKSRPFKYF